MFYFEVKRFVVVIFGALLNAVALNFFLIPASVYGSGFTGAAQLLFDFFSQVLGVTSIGTGIWLFLLNVPVAILGWMKVGKGFTIYSLFSVACMTVLLEVLPIHALSDDIILNAVFGGVIAGVGVGLTLKWGASTGGMDIVVMILSRLKDRPVGTYFLLLNGIIIILAGVLNEPANALYTLVTLYVSTRVIDAIHTRYEKVTAMIVTTKADGLSKAIYNKMVRGITIIPVKGGYTQQDKNMLMLVITRYELYDLEHIIKEVDPSAFMNVVETAGIYGFFRKDK
ncbi:Uncharacterized membrane-anchored protein YitT, contains DUF161 and DUF2179 domains [Terribacillus halophilus]|uniref:Uncharacterized membrane-anchored protein YitT, contains DUF161 and DUF2179 domains n=1 Tax=Terribacillus halophilus TaxID=361279 RepID=A0A1G6PD71_9BACI|nr:YitT family protein [Terribacillus halophilus]SDC78202.1 Uncharacterized membrane-anchored protein YitT, contains DUF161 and DUF2179 domains [Terribacillus halophilus]